MIVPMKKLSIIVQCKDAAPTIERLRSLGVVHVQHQNVPKGKDISALRDGIALIDRVLEILSIGEFTSQGDSPDSTTSSVNLGQSPELKDWKFSANHIVDAWKRIDQVHEYARGLKDTISTWEPWREFDPDAIRALAKKNIYIKLYQISARDMKKLPHGIIVKKLFVAKGLVHCAVISDTPSQRHGMASPRETDIPFKEFTLPEKGLKELREKLDESERVIQELKGDIQKYTVYCGYFSDLKKSLVKGLEFNEVLNGMGQSGNIAYLNGFIPNYSVKQVIDASKKKQWGIIVSDPSKNDKIPTLVRNPRWVSIIAPVFKMIAIIPGYRELDISLWFLIFFSIFFGMLIGDAGYGVVFFALTLFAQLKFGKKLKDKSVFILFYVLSSCTIIWGALTGTFFGQEWLPTLVKPLIPALRDDKNIQTFCFLLGALHLSVAHIWRAITKLPSIKACAEAGWTLILWGSFFLAKMLILDDSFPAFGKWFFITGPLLVIIFTNPNKNIFKGIGAGLGNLFLNFVNSFTDVVSYIRLFAVGLATVAIADAFNEMAMGIGYNSVLTGAATSLILLLGHALNILLGPLAILVHGVRLNVLEFSGHLNITWSGFSYNPLKEIKEGE
ncbi:MAG: hypothetical protein ISS46_01895 [Candidatus Omnitrophica bacterium]|nr:hypothetical protein [Candidatus Omnitrophota bacterium]